MNDFLKLSFQADSKNVKGEFMDGSTPGCRYIFIQLLE